MENFTRVPLQALNIFVAESETLILFLFFFDVLDFTKKSWNLVSLENAPKTGSLVNPQKVCGFQNSAWNEHTNNNNSRNMQSSSGIRHLQAESTKCKWNLQNVKTIRQHLPNPLTFWRIRFHISNPDQLVMFACRGIGDKTNQLHIFERGILGNFVSGIHLDFGLSSKSCLLIPVIYRLLWEI